MRTTVKDKEREYRIIYDSLNSDPRLTVKDCSSTLQVDRTTAGRRMKEAIDLGYMSNPQVRKRSYANMKEYSYFVSCEDPTESFLKYSKDLNVVYNAEMYGSTNLWIVTKEKVAVEGDIITEGYRSDYHVSFAPNHSWERALEIMHQKVEDFNPRGYKPRGIIKTHLNETIEWDSEYEILYRNHKFNLREPMQPLMRKYLISWGKISKWLEELPKTCTLFTMYYPRRISSYDPHLFIFETDYQDFLIDLFSQLPTTAFFFNVSNKLFSYLYLPREYQRFTNVHIDIDELRIPLLVRELRREKIIKNEKCSLVKCYWQKQL